ncbi:putative holin-like toxin [Aerococcaceae bacterium zg-ZJ1578]|nr:putative holin-like toxin [Aerococcaceae bacterium zg-1578]MBK0347998.1 putative holin-like toxin [Aerococcaceae bacterium zg-1578]
MTAFEVIQTILLFSSFTISLIALCHQIHKDDHKK